MAETAATTASSGGGSFNWNEFASAAFSGLQYIPGIVGAAKGGNAQNPYTNTGSYNAPVVTTADNKKTWMWIGIAVGVLALLLILAFALSHNKASDNGNEK